MFPKKIERAARSYEAISYVWGGKTHTFDILYDEKRPSITENPHDALHRIRHPLKKGQSGLMLYACILIDPESTTAES
jgi:hypothetical protein